MCTRQMLYLLCANETQVRLKALLVSPQLCCCRVLLGLMNEAALICSRWQVLLPNSLVAAPLLSSRVCSMSALRATGLGATF